MFLTDSTITIKRVLHLKERFKELQKAIVTYTIQAEEKLNDYKKYRHEQRMQLLLNIRSEFEESRLYKALKEKAHANINILLDDDAYDNAYRMYKFLNSKGFKDRVRLIQCPQGYDASLINEKFGKKGIIKLLRSAIKLDEYTLMRY